MAIDSAAKRNSALIDIASLVILPDGAFDAGDRATLVGEYRGTIAITPPATAINQGQQIGMMGEFRTTCARNFIGF